MEHFIVDKDGNFLGTFVDGKNSDGQEIKCALPENGIEVEYPPQDGRQKYDFERKVWLPLDTSPQQ